VNEEDDTGWTALIVAAGAGKPRAVEALLAAVRLLLDAGADRAVRDAPAPSTRP
jgi:hypothetical protein